MKTLQNLMRTTTIEAVIAVFASLSRYDGLKELYEALVNMDGVYMDSTNILFAAEYHNWNQAFPEADFTASVYNVPENSTYGIMFVPRQKLLGYLVSDMSVEMYGKERVIGAILSEVIAMGIDECSVQAQKQAMMDFAREIEAEEAKSYKEMLEEMGISPEDLTLSPAEEAYAQRVMEENVAIRNTQIAGIRAMLSQ